MPNDETKQTPTRRDVIKTGVAMWAAPAAVLATTGVAAAAQTTSAPATPVPPIDPKSAFPKPPYPPQKQELPGIQSKMQPVPDCGEKSYRGSGRLAGRKALVTGGDSGIGRAAAIAFAREGADVAIVYLPVEESDAQEVKKVIEAEGRKAVLLPTDITLEANCAKLVADAIAQLGGLDILVNNAGTQSPQESIEDVTTEQFDRVFKTNVYAPFWITKAAVPHLPAGASIINTASIQAYQPSPSLMDYAQTKACNINFTKSMAQQLSQRGIRVNAIAPGPFWTPLQPASFKTPDGAAKFGANTEFGRGGQPVELASAFVLLASNEASYMTGEVIGGTGGKSPF